MNDNTQARRNQPPVGQDREPAQKVYDVIKSYRDGILTLDEMRGRLRALAAELADRGIPEAEIDRCIQMAVAAVLNDWLR
jgi:hypothetical protein